MSADIVPFHSSNTAQYRATGDDPAPAEPARAFRSRPRNYRLSDMARLLGMEDNHPRTIIERLRLLAEQMGLPLPRNPRIYRGKIQRGAMAIGAKSQWDAAAVEHWLDRPTCPPGGAAKAPPAPSNLRAVMADRAQKLAARA
ncbi:hypothetical protein [Croceicoccus sp. YJ47]|uniref:hypothetical protein n=1 Tax=Croceicoccus sp. YJ47 TaxID=2798724 RepID=UPI001923E47F|nr:hypothetical protein [Croceicoccus sp. YJ47]QQN75026.1 hypothetical protein JD971_04840 [Croceicoccus sp. YJ47]